MDLEAYGNINHLSPIAKANGIEIPRLHGYRLMKDEEPLSKEEIENLKSESEIYVLEDLYEEFPFYSTNISKDYFFIKDNTSNTYIGIRWDRIHGRKRKVLKFEIKKRKRKIQQQFDMWNKYAGQENVLYIHSRMGGKNWKFYEGKEELMNQPWYLDRVDDHCNSSYCDFYARIK